MNEKDQKAWREILHGNAILNSEDAVKLYEENKRLQAENNELNHMWSHMAFNMGRRHGEALLKIERLEKDVQDLQDALYTALKKIEDSK